MIRVFMSSIDLEALQSAIRLHARSSLRPSCHEDTKTDQTHGRSVALLAPPHPKCPFQVGLQRVRAFLTCLPSTGVLRSGRTIGNPNCTGQYACVPIRTRPLAAGVKSEAVEGLRLQSELAHRASVVLVLLGRGGMRAGRSV